MKVVAFSGSARKDGNTAILVKQAFTELEKAGIETELVQLAGERLRGCIACYQCWQKKDRRCAVQDDLLASPTYFADITTEIKALVDRAGMVARANDHMFRRKVGAGIIAVRRGGAIHAFDSLNHFFLISQMIIPGSIYWNMGIGREIGEVAEDSEGMQTMQILGENMAWLMKKLA